jgi:BNR repeat-like domain
VRPTFFKLAVVLYALAGLAWAAPGQFSAQKRLGLTAGDQWEPALAADAAGHIYVLYPHYGDVPNCQDCTAPTMLLVASDDNGKTWQPPRVLLQSGSGQYDAQIVVDPFDRRTLYAAWLQNRKRVVMLAKSVDSGATWSFNIAARSEAELDKPVLAVRGQRVYLGFNREQDVWVAASQDGGRTFTDARVNNDARAGWSLLGGATVDPAGNAYLAWASYSKAGGARGPVNLYVARSADAGKTWNASLLDVSAAAPGCDDEDCSEAYLGAQIALTSDAGGTLYALWSSGARRQGPQRIFFSSSVNGGENWLPPVSLSSAARGVEHAFPAIVAGSSGDVRVAWMDSRNTGLWNTYYRSSTNGGAAWSDETRLSGYVRGYRYIARKGFRFPFGDYFGIAIDNRSDTQVVWGEGMNYQSPGSIWYSSGR